jgi:hypothetical protein
MSAPEIAGPLPAPHAIIDAIAAPNRAALQRAATEGRLETATEYTFPELAPRASWVGVIGGAIGFFTFLTAVPMVVTNYLARTHSATLQMQGFTLFAIVAVNLALGFGMLVGHEWLHATVARALGANPTLAPGTGERLQWRASTQGFGRASYAAVLLGPLVICAVLWLILWALAPIVAAFLIVAATVNAAMSGADLWTLLVALRQPADEVAFVDQHPGFVAYRITAAPVAKPATKASTPTSSATVAKSAAAQPTTATKSPITQASATKTPTKPGTAMKSAPRPSGAAPVRPVTKPGTPASTSGSAKTSTSTKSAKKPTK